MKLLIGCGLLLLGFIFGVTYDQGLFDRTLRRDLGECQSRNVVLDDALTHATPTKFKKRDYIHDAIQRQKQVVAQLQKQRENIR